MENWPPHIVRNRNTYVNTNCTANSIGMQRKMCEIYSTCAALLPCTFCVTRRNNWYFAHSQYTDKHEAVFTMATNAHNMNRIIACAHKYRMAHLLNYIVADNRIVSNSFGIWWLAERTFERKIISFVPVHIRCFQTNDSKQPNKRSRNEVVEWKRRGCTRTYAHAHMRRANDQTEGWAKVFASIIRMRSCDICALSSNK